MIDAGEAEIDTTWKLKRLRFTPLPNTQRLFIRLMNYMTSGWVAYDDVSLRPLVTYNLTYDAENHLTSVSNAATATFDYHGDGKQVKATQGDVTTVYIGNYFECTISTSTMKKYFYAGATRVAMRTGTANPQ